LSRLLEVHRHLSLYPVRIEKVKKDKRLGLFRQWLACGLHVLARSAGSHRDDLTEVIYGAVPVGNGMLRW